MPSQSGSKKICASNSSNYFVCDPVTLAYCYKVATDLAQQNVSQGDAKSTPPLSTEQLSFLASKVLTDLLSNSSAKLVKSTPVIAAEEKPQQNDEEIEEKLVISSIVVLYSSLSFFPP